MSYTKYRTTMIDFQIKFLEFIDMQDNIEENCENFVSLIYKHNILNNQHMFKSILYLISNIAKNHHRGPSFFNKIYKILNILKEDIKKSFSNFTIFKIFKSNKLIILYLIEEQIITIDNNIYAEMTNEKSLKKKFHVFFQPELLQFKLKENIIDRIELNKEIPEDFYEKRKIGENDDHLCKLIREDLIDEFISYVNQKDHPINAKVKSSIYETNVLFNKKRPEIIEYAAFFGSTQIFKYLYLNNVKLIPSLWVYAVHGDDPEIINILEEKNVLPYNKTFEGIFLESIRCHHIDISNYIQSNLLDEKLIRIYDYKVIFDEKFISNCLHYYNFTFFPTVVNYNFIITYACKYDHFIIVESILKSKDVDLKRALILY